jgi:methyl-accepting chemotaxis protein
VFKSKTLTIDPVFEPSLQDRLNGAFSLGAYARQQFVSAAFELEHSADELDDLATDVQEELDHLTNILTEAIENSDRNRESARNLRALVETPPINGQLTLPFPA